MGPWQAGVLAVRVTRPPADGEANRAVLRAVAGALGLPPSALEISAGERSRLKQLSVRGLTQAELEARLAALGD